MNTVQLALDNIARFGEYTATYFEKSSFTNVQSYRRACQWAAVLSGHGVKAGDKVVVMMLNSLDVAAAFMAIWKLGAVTLPVTPMWNAREVRYVLEDSGAQLVITSPELTARLQEASAGLPSFREVLTIGASGLNDVCDIAAELTAAEPYDLVADCRPDELALLLYTSGTTGDPKGVMLSHENLIFIADSCYENSKTIGPYRSVLVLPLSHVYGVLMLNLGYRYGATSLILRQFETKRVLEAIQDFKVQRMALVPTMLSYLINHPEREKYDVTSLEQVNSGGAPLAESVRLEFEQLFDCRVVQGYGMSETAGALTGYQPEETYRVGSVGRALPGVELCIMDFNQQMLPPGEVGEICARGRNIMLGYLNKPEATRDTFADGWLCTGDVGYLDADEYLYITDRKKDLIIKGGENISPREIEEGIYRHPAVAEAAVFGMPDEVYGENIVAAIVLRLGQSLTKAEMREYISQYVTKFKVPARIEFLPSLPKNNSGKILKRALKDQFHQFH
jgi:long-chain acyl-CoA synthetase